METDKLIEALEYAAKECDRTNYGCQWSSKLLEAATALKAKDAQLAEKDEEIRCLRHNVAAMQSTLEQQAKNCEELLTEKDKQLASARNELCQQCGKYHVAHKGACDGCRWRGPQEAGEGGG